MESHVRRFLVAVSLVLGVDQLTKTIGTDASPGANSSQPMMALWFGLVVGSIVVIGAIVQRGLAPPIIAGLMAGGITSLFIDRVVAGDVTAWVTVDDLAHAALMSALLGAVTVRALTSGRPRLRRHRMLV